VVLVLAAVLEALHLDGHHLLVVHLGDELAEVDLTDVGAGVLDELIQAHEEHDQHHPEKHALVRGTHSTPSIPAPRWLAASYGRRVKGKNRNKRTLTLNNLF